MKEPYLSLMTDANRWILECTIRKAYELSEYITTVRYSYVWDEEHSYISGVRGFGRIMEEMIHLCLPYPDDWFARRSHIHNHNWKLCILDLLKKDHENRK